MTIASSLMGGCGLGHEHVEDGCKSTCVKFGGGKFDRTGDIRECGSVLYLGMATEILNLPYLCITRIMAKEATNPKPSIQRE